MSNLVLSAGQAAGVDMTGRFLKQDEVRVARVTGFAGTGKTTLIREFADRFGTPTILTPTGKAALRVGEATGLFASTCHRFLYAPSEDPKTGKPIFSLKPLWGEVMSDMQDRLVIVDEASMVDHLVWSDLLSVARRVGFYVLLMGDTFQLPPIHRDASGKLFSTLLIPTPFEVNLTEVIRQALGSPIIQASMILRDLDRPTYEALELLEPLGGPDLIPAAVAGRTRGGVTICYTNELRHRINVKVRETLNYAPDTLVDGEPLLVTQNNYDLNCWNGEVTDFGWWERSPEEKGAQKAVSDRFANTSMVVRYGVGQVNQQQAVIALDQVTGRTEKQKVGTSALRRSAKWWFQDTFHTEEHAPYLDCNYGYGLTCHKAQGSEFDEVLIVLEDKLRLLGVDQKRWLYTAVTRARKRVSYCHAEGR